jgi:lipopolysaccharide transport protein LptA
MTLRNGKWVVIVAMLAGVGAGLSASPVAPGPIGKTVITSDTLLFDYRQRMCVFEGNVVVTEPRVRMESQKLHVFFDASNNLESVVATEAVKVTQANGVATCGRAVYTVESGAIVMTIDPVLRRERDELRGDEIKIFIHSEKVISTPGRVVFYPTSSGDGTKPKRENIPGAKK